MAPRRLVLLERHHGWSIDTLYSDANEPEALSEWYRYDALGRRVLVFTHHEKMRSCNAEGCESMLTRYVWAGDQLLYETRGPAADSIVSSWLETDTPGGDGEYGLPKAYGTVGYTHAGGIDRPLGVMRMDNGSLTTAFYPQLNWRGLYETATTDTGTEFHSRDYIKWPGAVASAYLGANTKPDSAFWWYGSQITESADASGLMYRRNRYYDPASGRFTQPDPAGIGGGLNGYGFAGGDPVSYSDPFGLSAQSCPPVCGGTAVGGAEGATGVAGVLTLLAAGSADQVAGTLDAAIDAARDKLAIKFVTYTRTGPNGRVYSGRTSGWGDPQKIVNKRAAGHPSRLAGFGPPVVDEWATGAEGYAAIRGREQQLIDHYGHAQSDGGTSANAIRGVSKKNPLAGVYDAAATTRFGYLPPAP